MKLLISCFVCLLLAAPGTAQCPVVFDIEPGLIPEAGPSVKPGVTAKGLVLFDETLEAGREAYWFDGQQLTGPLEIQPGAPSSTLIPGFKNLVAYGVLGGKSVAVFAGSDAGSTFSGGNWEPWMTDGSSVTPLPEIVPGPGAGEPDDFAFAGDQLFFSAEVAGIGRELWVSDGLTTQQVVELCPGGCAGVAQIPMQVLGDGVLFQGRDAAAGWELWYSDGTAAGTVLVADLEPGPGSAEPGGFLAAGDVVIFSAHTAAHGRELWRTDGVTASLVVDAAPGPASGWRRSLGVGFGQVFFAADDGVHGEELWALDLVTGNAALLADLRSGPASSYPYAVCALADGLLVMIAQQTAVSALYWLPWDGQQLGAPTLLHQGTFGLSALSPSFTPMGRGAYFSAPYGTTGHEVWYVEPGVSAPALVCDLWPGSGHSFPDSLRTIDDRLMFRASDPVHGYELRTLHTGQATAQTIDPPAAYTSLSVTPPVLGKTMRIEHLGGLPGAPTAIVFGPSREEPLVTALGALAWVAPSQATVLATGVGSVLQLQALVPAYPALAGVRLHVQAYSVPGHTSPFDLSNAVRIVLGN